MTMRALVLASLASASAGVKTSSLQQSRVLRLRGGQATAGALASPQAQTVTEATTLQLTVVAGNTLSLLGLSDIDIEALKLSPGDRVFLNKVKKSPWWAPAPNQMMGEITTWKSTIQFKSTGTEGEQARPGHVQVSEGIMRSMNLRPGDDVLISASAGAAAAPNGQPATQQRRRRHPPARWLAGGA